MKCKHITGVTKEARKNMKNKTYKYKLYNDHEIIVTDDLIKKMGGYKSMNSKNDIIHLLLLLSIGLTLAYTFSVWIGFVKVMNELEAMRIGIERGK